MNSLRPTCAVCHKLVDSFEEQYDSFFDRITFVATCHGQTERHTLNHQEQRAFKVSGFGLAFIPAKELAP